MNTQEAQTQTLSSCSGGLGKKEWTVVIRERKEEEKESWPLIKKGFTEAQRKELHEQAVINRHISAGLPVPLHLVLPIWKSVVSSLGPISIYKQYPSFLGYILQGFDSRNTMDPEPGRCRRTDGKKWRCSRTVLTDQKYCERHIHRGRQRSRKLVEASEFASPSTTTIPKRPKPEQEQEPPQRPGPKPSSVSVGLQLMTPSSDVGSARPASSFSNTRVCRIAPPFSSGTTVALAVATNSQAPTSAKCSEKSNIVVCRNMSRGLEFSPKSVLQGRAGLFLAALESGRCRRTDGKKWRCRRDVVPDQKYCLRHMHRGAKRLGQSLEQTASSTASSTALARPTAPAMAREDPDTSLCISIPTGPRLMIGREEERSSSSTSSDTTITDTSN